MFIIDPKPNREMQIMLRAVKMKWGEVPPHWKLYAGINPARFKMFMEEINYLSGHTRIDPNLFSFLRYVTACMHGFGYCERFNHAYLLSRGYTSEQLDTVAASREALPMDARHGMLFVAALDAMEDPAGLTAGVLETLYRADWSDADIFDVLDHAAFLFKFHKILEAYLA